MRHEGSVTKHGRHYPYKDSVGKLTLGYGRNLDDNGISETEARYLLATDIQLVIKQLHDKFPWFGALDDVRQEVLLNMAFNMGIKTLLEFKNTLKCVAEGDFLRASQNMLASKWATQVGHRAVELAMMMETGNYVET